MGHLDKLIDKGFEHYKMYLSGSGIDAEAGKFFFLGGINTALGLLTGSLNVGIREGTPSRDVVAALIAELENYVKTDEIEIRAKGVKRDQEIVRAFKGASQ
jgi:hypothetical protein